MRVNETQRTIVDGEPAPDRNDEYRFYQALVGDLAADDADGAGVAPRRARRHGSRPT